MWGQLKGEVERGRLYLPASTVQHEMAVTLDVCQGNICEDVLGLGDFMYIKGKRGIRERIEPFRNQRGNRCLEQSKMATSSMNISPLLLLWRKT